jgi:hypothetical protein
MKKLFVTRYLLFVNRFSLLVDRCWLEKESGGSVRVAYESRFGK